MISYAVTPKVSCTLNSGILVKRTQKHLVRFENKLGAENDSVHCA